MPAAYPKPDAERRNRNVKAFDWSDLPAAGRPGKPPKLPALRTWSAETRRWWAELWSKPQATAWDQTGSTAVGMAVLYEDLQHVDPARVAGLLAELRAHEDRHGLNPKAMLQLRWRIVKPEEPAVTASKPKTDRRKRVLGVIDGGAA
ncbi:MAG: hypothetical protein AB7R77_05960 [Ilumatobacteraceae bacterium]